MEYRSNLQNCCPPNCLLSVRLQCPQIKTVEIGDEMPLNNINNNSELMNINILPMKSGPAKNRTSRTSSAVPAISLGALILGG